jgi:hypothetical protein
LLIFAIVQNIVITQNSMSERKDNLQDKSLTDVEKFLLLLSELNIIDPEKSKNPQKPQQKTDSSLLNIDNKDKNKENTNGEIQTRSRLVEIKQNLSVKPRQKPSEAEILDVVRSPSVYPFPSLLDELPFLKDIQPTKQDGFDQNYEQDRQYENSSLSNDYEEIIIEKNESSKTEEIEAVNLFQELLFGSEKIQIASPPTSPVSQSQPQDPSSENSSDDAKAIHMLQDILVVPELEELRSFKIAVEQKLGIVESQVNNPAMMNKIEGLESLLQDASLRLTAFGDEQGNIPMEIGKVRDRIAQLENQINQPAELVQLLLPIIAELLSLKTDQARDEMCQAITPIIAEVIVERSQLDRVAMSHAIADLLPNAISEQIRNSPEQIAKALGPEVGAAIREQIRLDRGEIVDALAPEMGAAIKQQIVLERDAMVDALYPVIGSTITKYLAEAIREINQKVEQSFSVEGVLRKARAKMQGVSEAELILKESVPFEIQAYF